MKKQLVTLIAALAFTGVAHAAGDADAGKGKSAVCMACHGADGNSVNPVWPKIAGQHPEYVLKQLMEFKAGTRTDPTMAPMVAALSEADMADLAAYFSSQKTAQGTADAEKVKAGGMIYTAGNAASGVTACMGCHSPNGAGNPAAKYPKLAGQHAAYVEKTLKDFRAGTRSNDKDKVMRDIAGKMSDAEIAAVAQYIQGLR